jgi:hypothetical protein
LYNTSTLKRSESGGGQVSQKNQNEATRTEENSVSRTWAKSTTSRMQKGGDLYIRPLTRTEMTAPLAWHEQQLSVCRRYGELADGTIGYAVVR